MSYRSKITAERDAWIRAVPGRTFEVSFISDGGPRKWQIVLIERGNVMAIGRGATWQFAFTQALGEAEDRRLNDALSTPQTESGFSDEGN